MELIIIAAMATNRVIGCHNTIPWKIPEEMAHFKRTTMGHTLIMGRHTYESIGAPLPGRHNMIVSANPSFQPHPACTVAPSLARAIALCQPAEKVFLIGGEQLYRAGLPLAQTLILSVIDQDFAGDAFFPEFGDQPFVLVEMEEITATVPLTILTYRRLGTSASPASPADTTPG